MTGTNRRDLLRYGAAGAVTAATAAVAAQGIAGAGPAAGRDRTDPRDFDETYRGKKIKGRQGPGGKAELHVNDRKLALTVVTTLFVPEDGSPAHVGTGYISALNHYDPVEIDDDRHRDGLRRMARKVVDILGDLELSPEAAQEHRH